MYREARSYTLPLTREMAEEHATMRRWSGDRGIRPARRAMLDAAVRDGRFHSPAWAVAIFKGDRFRMDGQCSSTVLAESNGHFPKGLSVHMREFECDTEQDMAELFMQFDRPESVRSSAEMAHGHAAIHEDLRGLSPRAVAAIVAGISLALAGGERVASCTDDRVRLIHQHREFAVWGKTLVRTRTFDRASVVAAIFLTHKVDPAAALTFWTLVVDESHPDNRNPTRVLAKFLRESIGSRSAGGNNRRVGWDSRAMLAKCIHAWNAWRTDRTTNLNYFAEAAIPEAE